MDKQNQSFMDYIIILLKGLLMGAADIIPGVSGGTIALITVIYSRLICKDLIFVLLIFPITL